MPARLLPNDITLARLTIDEFRAWSWSWNFALDALLAKKSVPERFARLTATPRDVVARARQRFGNREGVLGALAEYWASKALEGDQSISTWRLPDGSIGVEPPVHLDAVREHLREWKSGERSLDAIVTADLRTLSQLQVALTHARGNAPVLITGETGTGKGVLARAIHEASGRKGFHPINCTAIAPTLFESELFGHMSGSFTGAAKDRKGLVENAADGTLFLDEIGHLAPEVQPKLLHVLRERVYRRVGDLTERTTKARFVAATNAVLEDEIARSNYREDLFHRLSACRVDLPPLRNRTGDVDMLIDHFLSAQGHAAGITEAARLLLNQYDWPGNVAELSDAIIYAVANANGRAIDIACLPDAPLIETYPRRGTAAQVLLTARAAAASVDGSAQTLASALATIVEQQLENPPEVGGDPELDALVQAAVGTAAMVASLAGAGKVNVEDAVRDVRRTILLAELRHQANESGHAPEIVETISGQLDALLRDLKTVPAIGMVAEMLMNTVAEGDEDDRSTLRELARKLKRNAPLIAKVLGGLLSQPAAQALPVITAPAQPPPPQPSTVAARRVSWKDPSQRAAVEQALRDASGVKARAAKAIGVTQPYFETVVKHHDLGGLASELRTQRRAARDVTRA